MENIKNIKIYAEQLDLALERLPDNEIALASINQSIQLIANDLIHKNFSLNMSEEDWNKTHQVISSIQDKFQTVQRKGGFSAGLSRQIKKIYWQESQTEKLVKIALEKLKFYQTIKIRSDCLGKHYKKLTELHFTEYRIEKCASFLFENINNPEGIKLSRRTFMCPNSILITPKRSHYVFLNNSHCNIKNNIKYKIKTCINLDKNKEFIVKKIKDCNINKFDFSYEYQLTKQWPPHSNLLKVYEFFEQKNSTQNNLISYAFIKKPTIKTLHHYLQTNTNQIDTIKIIFDILIAIKVLHENQLIHHHICAENIFLFEKNTPNKSNLKNKQRLEINKPPKDGQSANQNIHENKSENSFILHSISNSQIVAKLTYFSTSSFASTLHPQTKVQPNDASLPKKIDILAAGKLILKIIESMNTSKSYLGFQEQDQLKKLAGSMCAEPPNQRPEIEQILHLFLSTTLLQEIPI